jgi:hypothetical protein
VNIIRLSERASGIAQGEVDVVPLLDQLVEILGFSGKGLLQEPEEVFSLRPLVVVSELYVVAPAGGGVFYDKAEVAVLNPIFACYLAVHVLIPE